ncbi:MAG TPA: UDP-3-O-(3-hydroxymyristoyl)glucosamine N-acyltransferase, partial [Bacteriovoracaceae bacterium]|nr:UDP-3-O-(3-hydroxymyristoyl)glucosamine N-acyltransferase [Bacteriovoracaceae bacterium]
MKLAQLKQFDSTLEIVYNQSWPEEILAISSLEHLAIQSVVFIKNARFLNKFLPHLEEAKGKKIGVIVDAKFYSLMNAESKEALSQLAFIATTANVALSLTSLSKPYYEKKFENLNSQVDGRQMGTTNIDASARIAQGVFIGENVTIGADVVIHPGVTILPEVVIGEKTVIYPNVTIYPFTKIGKSCRIHSGVVIGSDGFGYTFDQGVHKKIWHMGGVEIHDHVEIGSNTSIDQGTFSPTIIGAGTRIDNLVQIAHNCRIGKGCILCGQSGLAGSVTLEDYVVLGGRAAVGPDSFIGMGSQIAGGAKVNESAHWPAGSKLGGHPAKDLKEWMRGV